MKKILVLLAIVLALPVLVFGDTTLKKDANNVPMQGALTPAVAQSISISGTTAKNSTAFTKRIIRVYTTTNCFYKLGDSSVTATNADHFLAAGQVEYFAVWNNTYIAAIQSVASGTMYISEMD
jgi:hypothetical protein